MTDFFAGNIVVQVGWKGPNLKPSHQFPLPLIRAKIEPLESPAGML
jgi:hypothetical protein